MWGVRVDALTKSRKLPMPPPHVTAVVTCLGSGYVKVGVDDVAGVGVAGHAHRKQTPSHRHRLVEGALAARVRCGGGAGVRGKVGRGEEVCVVRGVCVW